MIFENIFIGYFIQFFTLIWMTTPLVFKNNQRLVVAVLALLNTASIVIFLVGICKTTHDQLSIIYFLSMICGFVLHDELFKYFLTIRDELESHIIDV